MSAIDVEKARDMAAEFEHSGSAFDKEFKARVEQAIGAAHAAAAAAKSVVPSDYEVEMSRMVLLQLLTLADSIIADPVQLAERAWQISDAMLAEYRKRCK